MLKIYIADNHSLLYTLEGSVSSTRHSSINAYITFWPRYELFKINNLFVLYIIFNSS